MHILIIIRLEQIIHQRFLVKKCILRIANFYHKSTFIFGKEQLFLLIANRSMHMLNCLYHVRKFENSSTIVTLYIWMLLCPLYGIGVGSCRSWFKLFTTFCIFGLCRDFVGNHILNFKCILFIWIIWLLSH